MIISTCLVLVGSLTYRIKIKLAILPEFKDICQVRSQVKYIQHTAWYDNKKCHWLKIARKVKFSDRIGWGRRNIPSGLWGYVASRFNTKYTRSFMSHSVCVLLPTVSSYNKIDMLVAHQIILQTLLWRSRPCMVGRINLLPGPCLCLLFNLITKLEALSYLWSNCMVPHKFNDGCHYHKKRLSSHERLLPRKAHPHII